MGMYLCGFRTNSMEFLPSCFETWSLSQYLVGHVPGRSRCREVGGGRRGLPASMLALLAAAATTGWTLGRAPPVPTHCLRCSDVKLASPFRIRERLKGLGDSIEEVRRVREREKKEGESGRPDARDTFHSYADSRRRRRRARRGRGERCTDSAERRGVPRAWSASRARGGCAGERTPHLHRHRHRRRVR